MEPQQWKPLPVEYRRPEVYEVVRGNALGAACLLEPHASPAVAVAVALLSLRCVRFRRHRR